MKHRLQILAALVWLSALAEVGMRDRYHDMLAQVDNFAWLAVFPLLVAGDLLLTATLRRFRPRSTDGPRTGLPVRHLLLAVGLWLWTVPGNGPKLTHFVEALAASAAVWALLGFCDHRWGESLARWAASRGPVALTVAAIAFVAVPPVAVTLRSDQLTWPDIGNRSGASVAAQARQNDDGGPLLVLLLDELSFKASGPVVRALEAQGLVVSSRAVTAVGDATAKVIPAMWLRRPFSEARPCGPTAICSGLDLLEFSNVKASWPDIDVVGFYHPYCAMQGLRWCRREAPPSVFSDTRRVGCALGRRLHIPLAASCLRAQNTPWLDLVRRVESSYWEAPFWRDGGVLFAHLPVPHPPAAGPEASLAEHYAAGVDHAAAIVARSARQLAARAGGSGPRIVITSDHPLRVREWCSNGTYSAARCSGAELLRDSSVPLIVAVVGRPVDLSAYRSNDQLFDLVSALRARAP